MAIGEDNTAALINDEAGGVAGGGGLSIEGASSGGAEDDDGGNDSVERFPPILGGYRVFLKWRIDFHAEVGGGARIQSFRSHRLRWISHFEWSSEFSVNLIRVR